MNKLTTGEISGKCIKWEEIDDTLNTSFVTVSIDEDRCFLFWKKENKIECVEISLIRDIRISAFANIPKNLTECNSFDSWCDEEDVLDERCITICTGSDFVNIEWINFVAQTKAFATRINEIILDKMRCPYKRNPSQLFNLKKVWRYICIHTDMSDPISLDKISVFFSDDANGRKMIEEVIHSIDTKSETIDQTKFTFDYFLKIYEKLMLQDLLDKICGEIKTNEFKPMANEELAKFINENQCDNRLKDNCASTEQAKKIISKYEPNIKLSQQGILSLNGFARYMLSDENRILDNMNFELSQDMNEPLNHYFINSSHNTYLTGIQIMGTSSAEIYRQILLSGCRCIEIDIWDGDEVGDEPIVTHGHTATTKIPLREVLDAVAESAFKINNYPVIISFEDHCTLTELPILSSIVLEKLKNLILENPLETNPLKPGVYLPSPEKLKRKILVKDEIKDSARRNQIKEKTPENPNPQIGSFVNYINTAPFESFEAAKLKNVSYDCCAFDESSGITKIATSAGEFINFNKRQTCRIYPKGLRIFSGNYIPQMFWNVGCQLAALNFQTLDLGIQLNLGTFDQQNGCGYLLKPIELRTDESKFDPFVETYSAKLELTIISGQFISDKEEICFVECQLFGMTNDMVLKCEKIKSTTETGINPKFPDQVTSFKIIQPKLATLRIMISSESKKFIGQAWLPVDKIQPGYKFVSLKSESCQVLMKPSILIHIVICDYVCSDKTDIKSEEEQRNQRAQLLQNLIYEMEKQD